MALKNCVENFLIDMFQSNALYFFTRSIYMGIVKNLYRRVDLQHYIANLPLSITDLPP